MPEAPEVAYLRNRISRYCKGRELLSVKIKRGRYAKHGPPENFDRFVKDLKRSPLQLKSVTKKGKVLFLYFDNNWCIISKLGLTGWWYTETEGEDFVPNLVFRFSNDVSLYYYDTLSYGTLTFTQDGDLVQRELDRLAPEIEKVSLNQIRKRIGQLSHTQRRRQIEDILIDQTALVSGIGNYLKSEILYKAGISPKRRVASLSENEVSAIIRAGKTLSRQKNITFTVYQQETDPFGNKVVRYKNKQNRSTFWVPSLQT